MVGRIADFSIETSEVGNGQLTVDITYNGRSVPAQIEPEGSSRYHITFSPVGSGTYIIKVYFNGQEIQGSPYTMEVIDAKDVVTTGEGINSGEVGRRSSFFLNLGMGGSANDVKVLITSPRGNTVPANITDARNGSVTVEFVPRESGEHILDVTYFDKPVAGSPFACQVSDLNKISIMNLPSSGIVNRPVEFDIDASSAGQGNLEISVNDGDVKCAVQNQGGRLFHASFFPQDPIPHMIQMKFNGQDVPGSPWRVDVRNPPIQPHVSTTSNIQFVPVGMQAEFEFRGNNANGDFQVSVTTPSRRLLPVNIINMRNGSYRAEFTPEETGSHVVQVLFDGVMVPGSPFISKAYNVSAIIVSPPNIGIIGLPMEFTIDVTKAGEGKLEIMVNKGTVQNTVKMITKGIFGVNFIPHDARPHIVDILFNGEPVPQSPISIPIMDSRGRMVTGQGSSLRETAVNQQSSFQLHGQSVSEEDLTIKVTSPTGEMVPAKMVLQPDGDYKVEYSSRFTGRHMVEIMHAGVAIMGSPFYVEIYDPNKIRIEGNKTGLVGERMEFDIIRHQAGKADLKLIIKGPRGNPIKYEMYLTAKGDHVSYIPQEMGIYQLMITYGGLNVPGCPIKQEITDNSVVIASGEGLVRAIEDRVAVFYVDTKGQRGDLHVQVDGPKSIAKCNVESSLDGRYTVSYIPVEVGIFNVRIKWNSREIEGSPFRPRVGAATSQRRGVSVVGGWESLLDANNRMRLTLNETKRIEFDIRDVEPGQLSTSLRGPRGPLQVDMQRQDEGYRMLSFTPREEGEYRLKIFWNGKEIDRSPLLGICRRSFGDGSQIYQQQQQQHSSHYESTAGNQAGNNHATGYQPANIYSPGNPSGNGMYGNQAGHQTNQSVYQATSQTGFRTGQGGMGANQPGVIYNLDKVVMTGIGLQQALVHQHAEFYIDGSNAGPGMPTVSMNGPGGDLLVQCLAVTPFKYKCTYFPTQPGIYLLHISWADRQVIGSPYKVNVQTTLPSLATPTPTFQQAPELSLPVTPAPTLVVPNAASQLGATSQLGAASQLGATYSMTSTNLTTRQSTVASSALASKVFFTTDGLQGSLVGKDLKSTIDTRKAGPGELTAQCAGPTRPALCKLEDFRNGVFTLVVKPLEAGKHLLQVKYNGEQVQGSPFAIKVSGPPDPSKVRVFGPGIMPGVLSIYQSRFTVDTQGAGAGDLTVTIRGPKGGFRVEMQRKSQKDRDILCRYDPVEPGDYIIQVKWSGEHVPGSPFHVRIAGSEDELRVFQQQNQMDYRYNDYNGDYN